ncbi:WD40-repeat-containing domain protein [Chytriomyces sp. MP71]|nr:WD40-repeat-containing domain protein [Chytriomyces sp. MP71]
MIAFTDMADPGLPTRESIAQADSAAITGITWRSLHDLAYCTDAGRIGLVDRRIPKVVSTFHDLQNEWVPLNCIAVHPTQNTTLATGDADGQVKVWDLRNTKQPEVRSFGMHSSDVWDVVFPSTNAFTIASASQDGTLAHFTWNENNPDGFGASSKTIGLKEKRISGRGFSVNGIDCHPEVPLVVAVGDGGQVVLTDL